LGMARLGMANVNETANISEADLQEFTDKSRAAIKKGTGWLIKSINSDGGAGLDIGTASDVACTSVVGVALLSQGQTPMEGEHHNRQKRLANFLLRRVETMGSSGALQSTRSQIEGDLGPYATHFFATICLGQMMGESPNVDRYFRALQRLEGYISSNQHRDGSWGSDAWAPLLATACGWISLRAANFAGISVAGSSDAAGEYLIRQMPQLGREWGTGSWYHRLYGTAAGLRVLYAMGRDQEEKAKDALADILALVETNSRTFGAAGGEEYLTFHYMTEMLMQMGGDNWVRWYPNVRDKLIDVQNRDGSWTGHHCITSRTFSTACALMVLSAPNRFLPISQV
ncbi:MAG: prenyltransferase/squalene oxidase repeat-containing protein, partial [Pirellulaceae bacterium]